VRWAVDSTTEHTGNERKKVRPCAGDEGRDDRRCERPRRRARGAARRPGEMPRLHRLPGACAKLKPDFAFTLGRHRSLLNIIRGPGFRTTTTATLGGLPGSPRRDRRDADRRDDSAEVPVDACTRPAGRRDSWQRYARRLQTYRISAQAVHERSPLVGGASPSLGWVEAGADHRVARTVLRWQRGRFREYWANSPGARPGVARPSTPSSRPSLAWPPRIPAGAPRVSMASSSSSASMRPSAPSPG
jgi:hypothetical protein